MGGQDFARQVLGEEGVPGGGWQRKGVSCMYILSPSQIVLFCVGRRCKTQ